MTYRGLKYCVQGLLTSDNVLPEENDVVLALLGMAYNHVANKCTVLNLMTLDKSAEIVRLTSGKMLLRRPELPTTDDDILDVDEDICYIVASLVASYVSKDKVGIHQNRADVAIRDYNAKVTEIIESLQLQEDGSYDV